MKIVQKNANKEGGGGGVGIDAKISQLSPILDDRFGLIKDFEFVRQHYDEPKFWNYAAVLNSNFYKSDGRGFSSKASGISLFSQKLAILKCLGESIERYCNFLYQKSFSPFVGSFDKIVSRGINPKKFVVVHKEQLKDSAFKVFKISNKSLFSWSECLSLISKKSVLIPSQLIYLSYPHLKDEPTLYPGISTGAAGGFTIDSAIVRGIYEIVERDAFMVFYLNKISAPQISLELIKTKNIQNILRIAKRYKLEIISLDITTDLDIPVVVSIVIDRTGIGKAISVGLKSSFEILEAIEGSITEAFHTRDWIRKEYEINSENITPVDLLNKSDFRTRGLLWYPKERIKNLDFWIKSKRRKVIKNEALVSKQTPNLQVLLKIFKKLNYDVYYKDLTLKPFQELGYHIVKVIIPQMQPLYLNEKYPLLGNNRLYTVPKLLGFETKNIKELNDFPHPFL